MADDHQHESKSAAVASVEAGDRGLFDFMGKKEEEKKKCEGEVMATEFEEKVKVSEEKKNLVEKLHRSSSSSSSSSDEDEVEEGGEKKKKKEEFEGKERRRTNQQV